MTRACASDANNVSFIIPQPAVEALDKRVLHGFALRDVAPFDTALVHLYQDGVAVSSLPLSPTIILGFPRLIISRSSSRVTRSPEAAAIGQLIRHKVERPLVSRRHRNRHRRPGPERPLATTCVFQPIVINDFGDRDRPFQAIVIAISSDRDRGPPGSAYC